MDKKIIKRTLPFILCVVLLVGTIILSMKNTTTSPHESNNNTINKSSRNDYNIKENEEMKAVWVPFMALEDKNGNYTEAEFKSRFDNILADSKNHGINTMVVHVRPFGDALYKSNLFPWSHILSGTQGNDPGFDPLEYMIEKTHSENMAFHAWINPLRIQSNNTPSILCESNLYNKWKTDSDSSNDNWVLDSNGNKYFNPYYPEVRKVIIDGIKEIVENYDVDGIHFDDYFYPTDNYDLDKVSYNEYTSKIGENAIALSQDQWRTANINTLVSGVYSEIKNIDPSVQFGISPQANISNDLKMSADVYSWGSKSGYVDYLCPQLYVNFDHPALPYNKAADMWKDLITNENVKYYIGLGLYKAGSSADNGTWQNSNNIIQKEIEYGRNLNCNGFMLYSWEFLSNNQTSQEVSNAMKILNN